ncbi:MAG: protein kinase [Burkholderiales bacterium]|nr:protein kinase [Burkholderiales bacterium]
MAQLSKLGKYQLRRELGKGAMGIVYEGFDPMIERTVAIKTIRPEQLNKDQAAEILARFRREAQAAGRLSHPHIVSIYEYGEDAAAAEGGDPIAFIAMEFIRGRELRDYFEANERFPLKEIERIMAEILDALQHAHERGVVHRDMKPANVILLDNGAVKVADFGIARLETSELTQAGAVLGTPAYMSPEQFLGQTVDNRSDIFSCGVMLYQFLTGEKPFTGNVTTIMFKVLTEEPLAPSMLNTTLPPAWDSVVRKAMAKKVDERYRSAAEFSAAIRGVVAARSGDATLVQQPGTIAAAADATLVTHAPRPGSADDTVKQPSVAILPSAAPAPQSSPMPPLPLPAARKPLGAGALAGMAAAGIVVVGALAYFLSAGDRPAPQQQPVALPAAVPASAADPQASAVPVVARAPVADVPAEPGTMVISALGLVDPNNPRFNGDQAAAQAEARADAKRQLIDKALGLYVQASSLDKNYPLIEQKLLADPGVYIKTVISEGAPQIGKDGLMSAEARAAVKVRALQKSLNQMSKEERVEFIRNSGDPKISVVMTIRNADTADALPPARSLLAENVIKERIRSFGFRVWAPEGDAAAKSPDTKAADFQILGEAKVKLLSMRLPASGVTVSKTALTSWTIKAVERATGEEIYLNTTLPRAQSWASEDQALVDIGRLVGEEFSKSFFLQHFSVGEQKVSLAVTGLPAGAAGPHTARQLLRELRGIRQVLDAQLIADSGRYQLRLAEGASPSDIIQDAVLKPLNAKLGQTCFTLAGASAAEVNVALTQSCADDAVRARMESEPPAGVLAAPQARAKALLKQAKPTSI